MSLALAALLALTAAPPTEQMVKDFTNANERALGGDPRAALGLYRSLVEAGLSNEDLYYNLGTVAAERGDLVDAVVWFERALRLRPADEGVARNLDEVRARLRPKSRPPPSAMVHTSELLGPWVGRLGRTGLGWAAASLSAAFFALLLARRWVARPALRAGALPAAIGVGVALALVLVASALVELVDREPRAVARAAVELKDGPHQKFGVRGQLYAGETVRPLAVDGAFTEVLAEDGTRGFAPTKELVEIPPLAIE